MHKSVKKFFIPHRENNYHPHILHTKRAVFYSTFLILIKIFIIGFVAFLPAEVFVLPDVLAEEQRQIIDQTNEMRKKEGKKLLAVSDKLNVSAQNKADDMAVKQYFAHNENNRSVADWVASAGYKYRVVGENLAVGFSGASEVMAAWEESPTHLSNLVDVDFVDFGVGLSGGVYNGVPTVYIAQHFASPKIVPAALGIKVVNKEVKTNLNPAEKLAVASPEVVSTTAIAEVVVEKTAQPAVVNLQSPTPIEKYVQAKTTLAPITKIFQVSNTIYFVALVFFVSALAMMIFIEIKKQHPRIILQTFSLIGLIIVLWNF